MDIRRLVHIGLLAALVAVATLVLRIPMPATVGYKCWRCRNRGWRAAFGWLERGVGWRYRLGIGRWARGICSLGAFHLVFKGGEGLFIGRFYQWFKPDLSKPMGVLLAGLLASVGLLWMVIGYFVVEIFLYIMDPALASLPGNLLQAGASLVLGLLLVLALHRSSFDPKTP